MAVIVASFFLFLANLQVNSPSEWSVQAAPLPVVVISDDGGSTEQLRVAGAFVGNADRNALAGDALVLCKAAAGPCDPVSFADGNVQTVYLRYQGKIDPGVYAGRIIIHSGKESSKAENLTLYVSSRDHMVWGVLAVVVGGFLAWWVKVYASNRVTRDQALLPVAVHYERLTALDAALKKARAQSDVPTPKLSGAVAHWMGRLDINALEIEFNLPRRKPSPFTSTPTISSNFTGFLSQADTAITLLTIFVREGVEQVLESAAAGRIPSPKVSPTLNAIDDLYDPQLTQEVARVKISDVIKDAQAAGPEADFAPAAAPAPPPSLNQLLIEIRRLNLTAWCVLLAMAAIGTIITLVLKPGFGRTSDYLLCLITSFGIPMLGSVAIPSQTAAALVTTSSHGVSGSRGSGVV